MCFSVVVKLHGVKRTCGRRSSLVRGPFLLALDFGIALVLLFSSKILWSVVHRSSLCMGVTLLKKTTDFSVGLTWQLQ